MPLITIIRHAKTEPGGLGRDDFNRTLLERGRLDSQKLGHWCQAHLPEATVWLVSPAKRTLETAQIIATHWQEPKQMHTPAKLYGASSTDILALFEDCLAGEASTEHTHLLLIGHNPGVSEAVWQLSQETSLPNFPTAALAHFRVTPQDASHLKQANAERLHFVTAKALGGE